MKEPINKQQPVGFTINDSNILKGIAIFYLMVHHCFLEKSRYEGFEINFFPFKEWQLLSIAGYGKVCLAMFVFVSAYGLTIAYSKAFSRGLPEISKAAYQRLLNLYFAFWPAYIICIAGCALWYPERLTNYSKRGILFFNIIFDILGISYLLETPSLLGTWWYLSLAIVIIFLVPLMLLIYRYISGPGLMLLCILFSRICGLEDFMSSRFNYLLVIAFGIWAAETNFFSNLHISIPNKPFFEIVKIGIIFILIFTSYKIFHSYYRSSKQDLSLLYSAIVMAVTVKTFVRKIPVISSILSFIGMHSMNIFIIHNFIRAIWFDKNIYHLKFWWIIVLVLLGSNLLLSVIINTILKVIHYDKFIYFIKKKLGLISV